MKKIFLFLLLAYSYGFSWSNASFSEVTTKMSQYYYTISDSGFNSLKWQINNALYYKGYTKITIDFNNPRGGSDPCLGSPTFGTVGAIVIC